MSEDSLTLTSEQKFDLVSIKDRFLSEEEGVDISLMHLIQDVAGFKGKDGRSKEGRAVKAFLSEIDLTQFLLVNTRKWINQS